MKRNPIKTLRNKLDRVFSAYIRARDPACVTCGAVKDSAVSHAGHFIARQHMATRYDPRNVHKQCVVCNTYKHGNLIPYTLFMQQRYGQSVVDELMRLKQTTVRYRKADYEAMIAKFSQGAT